MLSTDIAYESGALDVEPTLLWDPIHIDVSIVIPCFNNAMVTRQCLKNLNENTDPKVYEIILVDDASTDATKTIESSPDSWIRVVRNSENLGFGISCNNGAQIARAEIIIFLNNDAFVMPHWLEPLLQCFAEDSLLGAVQPKLLSRDGVIGDAGGLMFADGRAWNYGKGQNVIDAPLVNTRRVPDYVSGACLAVRKEAFLSVGGFDPIYAPAYFEDKDLSFALQEKGWKLLYEPSSLVVHIEGATAGTDIGQGVKKYQALNEVKFREKWSEQLKGRPRLDPAIVDRWAFRPGGQFPGLNHYPITGSLRNILVITESPPGFDKSAGGKRMFEMLKRLRDLGHSVGLIAAMGIERKYVSHLSSFGIPSFGGDPNNPQFNNPGYLASHRPSLQKLLVSGGYDTVIISPWTMGEWVISDIRGSAPYVKVILDTCDVHFLRLERELALLGTSADEVAFLKDRELEVYRQSDALVCASEPDAEILSTYLPDAKIFTVPICHELEDSGPGFESRHGLLFVGNFLHPPNADALRWWRKAIMDRLNVNDPDNWLTVVGNDPTGTSRAAAGKGVKVLGGVEKLDLFYHGAQIAVAPLRYGAGMKGKVAEALSFGTPLIASPIAVEGMNLTNRDNVLIAESADDFANAIKDLRNDISLWRHVRMEGRNHIERYFGPGEMRYRVDKLIEGVWK